jgi:putative transposase
LQLIAGRVPQEYNIRKKRKGAFWEDRYHGVIINSENYLIQCMMYIDLNMVRAGIVEYPKEWKFCGFNEIMNPKDRYAIIDHKVLMALLHFKDNRLLQKEYNKFLSLELKKGSLNREPDWSNSIAVGSEEFIKEIKNKLGIKAEKRKIDSNETNWVLHDPRASYN